MNECVSFVSSTPAIPGVVTVMQDTLVQLHTTHSWDFVGLASDGQPNSAWALDGRFGDDTIIGNIDSGN